MLEAGSYKAVIDLPGGGTVQREFKVPEDVERKAAGGVMNWKTINLFLD